MKYELVRKGLVLGIILLFVGVTIASDITFKIDTPVVLLDKKETMDTLERSATVLLYENFSGTFPPEGWSTDLWTQCNFICCNDPPCACLIENQYENNSAYINSKAVNASEYGICKVTGYLDAYVKDITGCCFYIKFKTNETNPWKDITPWDNPVHPDWSGFYYIETWIINSTGGCGEALQIKFEYIGVSNHNSFCLDDVKIKGLPSNNSAPEPPIIDGPTSGIHGIDYNYTFASCDPDGDDVYYLIEWGDGTFEELSGPYPSCQIVEISHGWSEPGVYYIRAIAVDINDAFSDWSDPYEVVIGNEPPNTPTITGQTSGKPGIDYEYTFNSTDLNEDPVMFLIDWGDNTTEWTEYNDSGEEIMLKHNWSEIGEYTIKAKAIDIYGTESNWTNFDVKIEIPRNKALGNLRFLWLFERFPNLLPILRQLLRLG